MNYLADKKVLVLVADAARARFFSPISESDKLQEVETLVNGSARLSGKKLQSDRQGRSFDSVGGGRHAMEPSANHKDQVSKNFAQDVAHRLDELVGGTDYLHIALIAAPAFLGHLRKSLHPNTKNKVIVEISKDLTTKDANDIAERVLQQIRK